MKLYPAIKKVWLQLTAGLMWSGVGIMLISLASRWLGLVIFSETILLLLAGALLAFLIYFFGFSKMAKKNINRIEAYQADRVCLFAFQKWSSYPLIVFMVFLGIFLRVYSPIPKPYLAVLYFGLGGGLLFSSVHYYAQVAREILFSRGHPSV
jgi:hypothetical protein